MKSRVKLFSLFVMALFAAVAVPVALAQTGASQKTKMPKYDPSTVVTVKGTVEEVQEGMMQPGHMQQMGSVGQMDRMTHMGLHLTLKTENATYTVLVGPAAFVKNQGFAFAQGDEIEVTGSKVKFADGEALIAREIKKGGKTLTLRNEQGIPKWSRSPRS